MLKRLSKADLLAQAANVRRMAEGAKAWKVRIARRDGPMDCVHEVQTVDGVAHLCPVREDSSGALALMAKLLGVGTYELDLDALERELGKSDAAEVAIGWPAVKGPQSVSSVVRCIAIVDGGVCTTYIFPGPIDIESVNREIADHCAAHGCTVLRDGGDCEACPKMMECTILEGAEREARGKRRDLDTEAGDMIQ